MISSFIEEYEDIESEEVETLPPAKKESPKKQNKQEINQSSVVEEINNIIDLISNFKTVSSVPKTTEAPKLIETQERVLGLSDQGKSESQFGDLEFLAKLLINQKESQPSKAEPQSTTENSLSEKEIDKLLENLLGVSDNDEDDDVSLEQERKGETSETEDYEDYIDSVVENLVEDILGKESRKKERERGENDFGAVEEALTKILGKEPKKKNRISPDILETIIELDQFLKEEEEERRERVNKAKSLADRAIKLVTGSVEKIKAKTEKKTSQRNVEDDLNIESLIKSISQDQLRKLILS